MQEEIDPARRCPWFLLPGIPIGQPPWELLFFIGYGTAAIGAEKGILLNDSTALRAGLMGQIRLYFLFQPLHETDGLDVADEHLALAGYRGEIGLIVHLWQGFFFWNIVGVRRGLFNISGFFGIDRFFCL